MRQCTRSGCVPYCLVARCCRLQALYLCYAGLSAYTEFVQADAQQRQRPAQVPVEVTGGGKEKGKDKGELALVLSQEFYEQVCGDALVMLSMKVVLVCVACLICWSRCLVVRYSLVLRVT